MLVRRYFASKASLSSTWSPCGRDKGDAGCALLGLDLGLLADPRAGGEPRVQHLGDGDADLDLVGARQVRGAQVELEGLLCEQGLQLLATRTAAWT